MKAQLFNQNWKFWEDKDAFVLIWSVPNHAQNVTLPHDAMLYEKAYAESPNGGNTGFKDGKNINYATYLSLSEEDKNKRFVLKFEGVYMNAFVYINGRLAGKRHNGYSTFYVPLNDYLDFGQENEIRVQVRNGVMSNSRWYSGSGIYRDVYLLTSGALHIAPKGVFVRTIELSKEQAKLEVRVTVQNENSEPQDFQLETLVKDAAGKIIQSDIRPYFMLSNETDELAFHITVDQPQLWTAEAPYLYTIETRLLQKGEVVDDSSVKTGLRILSVDAKNGFQVNGETVKFRGACIHHDSGLIGAATYKGAHIRQVKILKEAGFNAIRMSHNPAAPALLAACDEIGMYVMDETFDMWTRFKSDFDYSQVFTEKWEEDVQAMVESDFNHPCVVMYSIGNEIPEIGTKHGSRIARQIVHKVKSMDPSRPTLASINGVFAAGDDIMTIMADIASDNDMSFEGNINDFMTLMDTQMHNIVRHETVSKNLEFATASTDIAGYNYMTARYEEDAVNYPNRVMVGSETYPPQIAENWDIITKTPSVIGDFTWTGWDYIGEAGVGIPAYNFGEGGFGAHFPAQLSYVGDIDITGFRRPASYYREIVFGRRTNPYISVQNPHHYGKHLIKTPWVISDSVSSWTWTGVDGQPVVVEVYAQGDEVALYLDDTLVERKSVGDNLAFCATFELPYQAGTLKAINYRNGKVLGEMTLTTADPSTKHLVVTEDFTNDELVYLALTLEDAAGNIINDADEDIELLSVTGANVIGFGSANPLHLEVAGNQTSSTYNGRAQLILRKTSQTVVVSLNSRDGNIEINL